MEVFFHQSSQGEGEGSPGIREIIPVRYKAPTIILLADLHIASHLTMQGLQSTWILEVLILHSMGP